MNNVFVKDILLQEDLKQYLLEKYNALSTISGKELTDDYAEAIAAIIIERFALFMNCPTIFDTQEEGIATVHNHILTVNVYALVNEIWHCIDAINAETGKLHRQAKYNPIDQEDDKFNDLEKAPINIDNVEFTLGQNWLDNINFIIENSKKMRQLAKLFINDWYITPGVIIE